MKQIFILVILMLVACTVPMPSKGSLQVNITGLPGGNTPSVQVSGPEGFKQTLTANTALGLNPGSYTFTPGPITQTGSIVDQVFVSSPKTVQVVSGANPALELAYTLRGGSGMLWVGIQNLGPSAFSPEQLSVNGSPTPIKNGTRIYYGMAFDREGNLWGVNQFLFRIPVAALAGDMEYDLNIPLSPAGTVVVYWGIAFDAVGNVWVAAYKQDGLPANRILMLRKADLGSASATPHLTLQSPVLNAPFALAFDAAGNLWASNESGTLVRYNAASLGGNGTQTVEAACSITIGGNLIDLAFDKEGNLFVASNNASRIHKLSAASLQGCSGSTPAAPVLTLSGTAIKSPYGMALDNGGNLWVANYSPNNLSKIAVTDLAKTGTQTVDAEVKLENLGTSSIYRPVFSPPPSGLSLYR